jgi:putative Mg2+ transporter-C (MgtC) family protein
MTNYELAVDILPKIIYAVICGAIIGYEREKKRAAAGIKTHILICVGSALYTVSSVYVGQMDGHSDSSRVIAQIVSGIGFLGAGAIIRGSEDKVIIGLTTAAMIWMMAAIGIFVGLGYGPLCLGISVGATLTITLISLLENKYIRNGQSALHPYNRRQTDQNPHLNSHSQSFGATQPRPVERDENITPVLPLGKLNRRLDRSEKPPHTLYNLEVEGETYHHVKKKKA